MVYFCIPYNAFSEDYKWIIDSSNTETIVNLLKIFALTSKEAPLGYYANT